MTDIKQQTLWGPILYPTFPVLIIGLTCFLAVLFFTTIILVIGAMSIERQEVRYDKACNAVSACQITFTATEDMTDPKIYYRLENYYGSHKKYVESRNYQQLRGDTTSTSNCSPVSKNEDIRTPLTQFNSTTVLDPDEGAIPWGLPAKYYFQDEFTLSVSGGSAFSIDSSDIALKVDKNSRFS